MNKIIFIVIFFTGLTQAIVCSEQQKKEIKDDELFHAQDYPELNKASRAERQKRLLAYVNQQYDLMTAAQAGLSGRFHKRQTHGSINSEYRELPKDKK